MADLFDIGIFNVEDTDGSVGAGWKLNFYNTGTTTRQNTYPTEADATAGTNANANPLVADAAGRFGQAWFTASKIKAVLTDENDVVKATRDYKPGLKNALASTASGEGAALVGYIHNGTDAVATTALARLRRSVSVFDFMTAAQIADVEAGTAGEDVTTALAAARAHVAATGDRLVFPQGRYKYSSSPNWAIQDAIIDFEGEVRLRYTGTGIAVELDGGSSGAGVFNCTFGKTGRVLIEAPSTATHAIRARSFHHGHVCAKVLGAGSTSAGLKTEWCVCTTFGVIVSVNHEGWYASAKPKYGYDLDQRGGSAFRTSYCTFPTPICEGNDIGIQLTSTLGNNFFGGTAEACTTYGVFCSTDANIDKFFGTDFEANTAADVYCQGKGVSFYNCESDNVIVFAGSSVECKLLGGKHKSVTLEAGSTACTVRDILYSRALSAGAFTDAGNMNRIDNIFNSGNTYPVSENENYSIFEEDFFGDVLADQWRGAVGTDAQCVAPAITTAIPQSAVRLVAGDDAAADMATNGVQLDAGIRQWRLDSGGFEMEFRFKIDAITSVAWFIGMTDQESALEMPFTLGAADALTSNASNSFGILFDTAADTDEWCLVGVKDDVDATKQFAGAAPVAGTWERWRIQVTISGTAKFYRNGVLIGSAMSNAVNVGIKLTPVIAGFSRTTATRTLDCDRIGMRVVRA